MKKPPNLTPKGRVKTPEKYYQSTGQITTKLLERAYNTEQIIKPIIKKVSFKSGKKLRIKATITPKNPITLNGCKYALEVQRGIYSLLVANELKPLVASIAELANAGGIISKEKYRKLPPKKKQTLNNEILKAIRAWNAQVVFNLEELKKIKKQSKQLSLFIELLDKPDAKYNLKKYEDRLLHAEIVKGAYSVNGAPITAIKIENSLLFELEYNTLNHCTNYNKNQIDRVTDSLKFRLQGKKLTHYLIVQLVKMNKNKIYNSLTIDTICKEVDYKTTAGHKARTINKTAEQVESVLKTIENDRITRGTYKDTGNIKEFLSGLERTQSKSFIQSKNGKMCILPKHSNAILNGDKRHT